MSSSAMSDHEKYLRGEPLNDELAALKEGRFDDPQPPERKAIVYEFDDPERPLTHGERDKLRKWRGDPGWMVFQRLLERSIKNRLQSATLLSQTDPLSNRDRIATEWAYVGIWKMTRAQIEAMVEEEIAKLTEDARG